MLSVLALSIGPEVAAISGSRGRVLAVLRNAVYLESEGGHVLGIVGAYASDGPVSLRVPELEPIKRVLEGRDDLPFRAGDGELEIGHAVQISWKGGDVWRPQYPQTIGTREAMVESAGALASEITASGQQEGSARLAAYVPAFYRLPAGTFDSDPLLRRMALYLRNFNEDMSQGDSAEGGEALTDLLGLGPGLTPSGDDVVAGILAVLVWQSRLGAMPAQVVGNLTASVNALAPHRTNRISARLLHHAGEGILYAPAMDLGSALLAGDPAYIYKNARRLFEIGSTSGVDIAIGLLYAVLIKRKR